MNSSGIIAKNAFAVLFAFGMQAFFLFLLTVYIARYLGDAELGKYSLAIGFTGFFAILINFGLNWVIAREVARNRSLAGEFLGNVITARLLLSVFAVLLVVISTKIMQYPDDISQIIYIFTLYTAIVGISSTFQAIFQAYEQMKYMTYIWTIEKMVIFVLGMLMFFLGYGLKELAFMFVTGGIANLILSFWISWRKFTPFKFKYDAGLLIYLIKEGLPYVVFPFLGVIFFQVTIVMLFNMKGSSITGIYSAAYYLLTPFLFASQSVTAAIFPAMSRISTSFAGSLKTTLEKFTKFCFILTLPVAIWVTFAADKVILSVFGTGFSSSIPVLQLLIWVIPIKFITSMLYTTLGALGKQRVISISAIICIGFILILNLFLIPEFGFTGAAVSTLMADILMFMLLFRPIGQNIPGFNMNSILFKPSLSAAVGLLVYFFSANTAILLISSTIMYIATLYLIGGVTGEDIELINSMRINSDGNTDIKK